MSGLPRWLRRRSAPVPAGRVRAARGVVIAERDGCAVLLDLRRDRYFGLDESGTRFWAVLSEGRTIDEAAGQLAEEYDAPLERLRADAAAFAARLCDAGLLEVA